MPQQIQSVSSLASWLNPKAALLLPAGVGVAIVSCVASQVFGLLGIAAVLVLVSYDLQDRTFTRLMAVGLTLIIAGISAAVLFPLSAPIILAATFALGSLCFAYSFYKIASSS